MEDQFGLLTVPEVARRLRVKVSTVYTWTDNGVLPHLRVGRLLRFDPEQINAWLEAQARQSRGQGRSSGA